MMLNKIISLSRSIKYPFPPLARLGKVTEEVGEFAETVMYSQGFLPHKSPKESPFGEASDAIICILDTLASIYPDMSEEDLLKLLEDEMSKKCDKWKRVCIDPLNMKHENSNSWITRV